ncbi:MAG: lysylphosphatidylglycerol synthase transmembrane domain-containing protein [Alphaproteobacteria bacterium]
MIYLRIGFLLAGVALLGVIVANTDFVEAAHLVGRMEWGIGVVLVIYLLAFSGDTVSWQLTFSSLAMTVGSAWRLFLVRMVGEAYNNTLPAGGMGGEPIKAILLNRRHGIDFREGTASLFLAKTVNMIALIAFLVVGFAIMQFHPALDRPYRLVAGIGLGVLVAAVLAFFAIQRYRVSSALATALSRWASGQRLANAIEHIGEVEERFIAFYTRSHARFGWALALAFGNWLLGVAEIYAALYFLGFPVSWTEAWIIEASAQLIRTGTFFIPASLGAQEGVFLLVCGAITGSPTAGIALALARRLREIIWIVAGFGISALLRDRKKR